MLPLLLPALFALMGPGAGNAAAEELFRREGTISWEGNHEAVAINADETLIAVAGDSDDGKLRVDIFDRPTRALLGFLAAEVGEDVGLAFSPHRDLLLVRGTAALELWAVSILALSSDFPVPARQRFWRQPLDDDGETEQELATGAGFGPSPDTVVWRRGSKIFLREATRTGRRSAIRLGWIRSRAPDTRSSPAGADSRGTGPARRPFAASAGPPPGTRPG